MIQRLLENMHPLLDCLIQLLAASQAQILLNAYLERQQAAATVVVSLPSTREASSELETPGFSLAQKVAICLYSRTILPITNLL